jgi:hypothetical protein
MEFEEMKKIWDTQNNEPIYGINEKALHSHIISKMNKGNKITHLSELVSIIAYGFTGLLIPASIAINKGSNLFVYFLAVWMLFSAVYCLISRIRRIRGGRQFDRSMHGDLEYAISVATYQVNFSRLVRWNTLPIALISVLGVWDGGKSGWIALGLAMFFALSIFASGWEHNIYVKRKRELEGLRKMLES